MNIKQHICPVCGAQRIETAAHHCAECGTEYAFVEFFASENTRKLWEKQMQQAFKTYQAAKLDKIFGSAFLIIGPEQLMFHDGVASVLTTFDRYGKVTQETGVRGYSVSNLHQVVLKTDGTPVSRGETDVSMTWRQPPENVSAVLAAPRCTYLVKADGTVAAFGTCAIREQIDAWKDIRELACGSTHLVGLTRQGTVVQADTSAVGRSTRETAAWRDVTAIAAASNYTLALHANGTVSYAGPKQDVGHAVATWKDVTAIAADSQFAVGLTKDGDVLLAGECSPFLDGGRSEAKSWKNVACLGTGFGVIGAVTREGELKLAGRFLHGDQVVSAFKKQSPLAF